MPNLYSLRLQVGCNDQRYLHGYASTSLDEIVNNLDSICRNVEILGLSLPNTNFRGVAKLAKLRSLEFRVLTTNMNADFRALVDAKKDQLTTLKIIDVCGDFTEQHYRLIAQFKFLETLHLPDRDDYYSGYSIDDDDLRALSALENLTEFKIIGQHDITNDGLLEFVDKCRKLKWVNIMKTCIDNRFAHKLLPVLKKISRPNGYITFLVYESKMAEDYDFPVDYSFKEIKKLAHFVFHPLLRTLKSYDNFDDITDKDNNFNFFASFCDDCL